jgi:hypothetical protein
VGTEPVKGKNQQNKKLHQDTKQKEKQTANKQHNRMQTEAQKQSKGLQSHSYSKHGFFATRPINHFHAWNLI